MIFQYYKIWHSTLPYNDDDDIPMLLPWHSGKFWWWPCCYYYLMMIQGISMIFDDDVTLLMIQIPLGLIEMTFTLEMTDDVVILVFQYLTDDWPSDINVLLLIFWTVNEYYWYSKPGFPFPLRGSIVYNAMCMPF